MSRSPLRVSGIIAISVAAPALASPVNANFTAGVITGGGFPEPSNGAATSMAAAGGSGGGSTGGGLDQASIAAARVIGATETTISFTGTASHINGAQFGGQTSAGTGNYIATTGNGVGVALTLQLLEAANFSVNNTGVGTINFTALTGQITGNILTSGSLAVGTYSIALDLTSTNNPVNMNWVMHLNAVPAPAAATPLLLGVFALARRRR